MKNKRLLVVAAASLVFAITMAGCSGYVDGLISGKGESSVSSNLNSDASDVSNSSGESEISYITGPITTKNAIEDISLLGRLAMPSNFVVTMTDEDEKLGGTSITMRMDLAEKASYAHFSSFGAHLDDISIKVPDFDMYLGGDALYMSENAMMASLTLTPQMSYLAAMVDEEITAEQKAEYISKSKAMAEATEKAIKATDKKRYVKLTAAEASSVPVILMTPVSSGMVSGFFGKDLSNVMGLFEKDLDKYCSTDSDGNHIFNVDKSNALAFFDILLGLEDGDILGLAMVDSYDDPLWSSISKDTWASLSMTVQARIDAYKSHWKECRDAVEKNTLDYSYRLTTRIMSDKDIRLSLDMHSMSGGVKNTRHIEISSVQSDDGIEVVLPDGANIITPEQWEADISPALDEFLGEFKVKDDSETSDSSGS